MGEMEIFLAESWVNKNWVSSVCQMVLKGVSAQITCYGIGAVNPES